MRARWGTRGEAGVSTVVIIIALVLVSGAAGSTLISTTHESAERAEVVFADSLQSIATGLLIRDVTGLVQENAVVSLDLIITLQAGSEPVNLSALLVHLITPRENVVLTSECYLVSKVLSKEGVPCDVLGRGEIAVMTFAIPGGSNPGESASISILVPGGLTAQEELTMPDVMVGRYVSLF